MVFAKIAQHVVRDEIAVSSEKRPGNSICFHTLVGMKANHVESLLTWNEGMPKAPRQCSGSVK